MVKINDIVNLDQIINCPICGKRLCFIFGIYMGDSDVTTNLLAAHCCNKEYIIKRLNVYSLIKIRDHEEEELDEN